MKTHDFVSLNCDFSSIRVRGPGVWKLNNSLLQDLSFRETIRTSINDHVRYEHAFPNGREWWDFLKRSLKEISLNYAKKKRAEANRESVSYK